MDEAPAIGIVASDSDWVCARWRNVLFLVWRGVTTAERAHVASRVLRETAAEHEAGIGIVTVVEPNAPPPDGAVRPIFAKGMREHGARIRACAYVVPQGGFGGAAVRAAITGLSLLAREPYPTRTFTSPATAAEWLDARLGRAIPMPTIVAAIERARRS